MNNQLCILDIETTGFKPEDSEILELYILKVVDNEIIDEFYSLFNTKQKIASLVSRNDIFDVINRHHSPLFIESETK